MGSAPKPQDPNVTAMAQYKFNKKAAQSQQQLNMVDQSNPYGSLTYTQTGTYADGTPKYSATTTLSPEQQALYDQQTKTQQLAGGTANDVLSAWSGKYGNTTGFDTTDTANYLYDLGNQRLAPQLAQQRAQTETALLNKGIVPGTEAYDRAMQSVGQQENDAWNQLYLTGQQQAYNQLQQNYQTPLQAYNALYGNSQAQTPNAGFVNTPQASVQAPNYAQIQQNYDQANAANQSSMLGGISSLAGTGLQAAMMFSDARLKKNVDRVGTLDNGLPVYAYEYKSGGPRHIGVMAQDVMQDNPDAVHNVGGFWAVDYGKAVA